MRSLGHFKTFIQICCYFNTSFISKHYIALDTYWHINCCCFIEIIESKKLEWSRIFKHFYWYCCFCFMHGFRWQGPEIMRNLQEWGRVTIWSEYSKNVLVISIQISAYLDFWPEWCFYRKPQKIGEAEPLGQSCICGWGVHQAWLPQAGTWPNLSSQDCQMSVAWIVYT